MLRAGGIKRFYRVWQGEFGAFEWQKQVRSDEFSRSHPTHCTHHACMYTQHSTTTHTRYTAKLMLHQSLITQVEQSAIQDYLSLHLFPYRKLHTRIVSPSSPTIRSSSNASCRIVGPTPAPRASTLPAAGAMDAGGDARKRLRATPEMLR